MKYLLTVFSLVSLAATAQTVAIENRIGRQFFLGVQNPLVIAVTDCKNDLIKVAADNGTIAKDEYQSLNAYYTYVADHLGPVTIVISVKTKTGYKEVSKRFFKVVELPAPEADYMGMHTGDSLSTYKARVGIAPHAIVFGGGAYGCGVIRITDFDINVIRKGVTVLDRRIHNDQGARMSDDAIANGFMDYLRAGDLLIFSEIWAVGEGPTKKKLVPLVLKLID